MQFAMLNYIDVNINGLQLPVHALIDGGSQVCVVNSKLIESLDLICVGNVLIKGITGSPVNCNLFKLRIALTPRDADRCSGEFVTIVCAACDDLNEQLILTLPVVDQFYAKMQSVVSQCDESGDVYDSSCDNDRVDILNSDYVDATVAVTTRAQSKLNVVNDVNIDSVDNNGGSSRYEARASSIYGLHQQVYQQLITVVLNSTVTHRADRECITRPPHAYEERTRCPAIADRDTPNPN